MSEQMTTQTRNEVQDGYFDCVIVSAKRADSEKALKHFVVSIGVRVADDPDAEAYWGNLPLCFGVGEPWKFYDRNAKANVERPATQEDTTAAWEFARKCFPDWAKYCDELDENAGLKAAIEWFGSEASKAVICHCKLTNRDGQDAQGNAKRKHYASFWEPKKGVTVADDDNTRFANALAASGIVIGRKVAKAAKASGAPVPAAKKPAPAPATRKAPPKPASKVYRYDDVWAVYEKFQKRVDPDGSNYWNRVAEITGKDAADWESFTNEDWRKCVEAFTQDF